MSINAIYITSIKRSLKGVHQTIRKHPLQNYSSRALLAVLKPKRARLQLNVLVEFVRQRNQLLVLRVLGRTSIKEGVISKDLVK